MRLPPKKFYQLYNLGSSKSTDMTIPKKQSITLVPVKTMDITLDFSVKRPAFISLKTKYPKGQFTFENASLPKNTSKVSSNVILVKKWPLKLTLIENEYDLELFDDNETFCKEKLNAKSSRIIECQASETQQGDMEYSYWPNNDKFANVQLRERQLNLSTAQAFIVKDSNSQFALEVVTLDPTAKIKWKKYSQQKDLPKLPLLKSSLLNLCHEQN